MSVSMRAAVRGAVLLASVSCGASAWAQAFDPATPRETVDDNGVDLSTGRFSVSGASVAIGGDHGLGWSQGRGNILRSRFYMQETNGQTEYVVTIGDEAKVFVSPSPNVYVPKERDGSKLRTDDYSFIYTAPNGDELWFDYRGRNVLGYAGQDHVPYFLRRPSGEAWWFEYEEIELPVTSADPEAPATQSYSRLVGIESTSGYDLRVRHAQETLASGTQGPPPAA